MMNCVLPYTLRVRHQDWSESLAGQVKQSQAADTDLSDV